jgi:hypothetical protein
MHIAADADHHPSLTALWMWLADSTNLAIVVASSTAIWALVLFRAANRAKATEVLLQLEEAYRTHLDILLEIELVPSYQGGIVPLLCKLNGRRGHLATLDDRERRLLLRLEAMLRHFYITLNTRHLRVEMGFSDRACGHYLRLMCDARHEVLATYIRENWPSLWEWSRVVGQPLPKRAIVYVKYLPSRLKRWWKGKDKFRSSPQDSTAPESMPPA